MYIEDTHSVGSTHKAAPCNKTEEHYLFEISMQPVKQQHFYSRKKYHNKVSYFPCIYFHAALRIHSLKSPPHKFAWPSYLFYSYNDSERIKIRSTGMSCVHSKFQTLNQQLPIKLTFLIKSETSLQAGASNYSRINNFNVP